MPEHNDPIEELSRFGAGFGAGAGGGDMSRSAADARRRGDQIRQRRRAVVAGASALAVAAVAVPVFAVVGGDGDRRVPAVKDPNDGSLVLGQQDLLTDDDTVYTEGADWFATDTYPGDGQAAFHLCAQGKLTGLGATGVYNRTFELRNAQSEGEEPPPDPQGDLLSESIAQFPDVASASAAYDTIQEWIRECTENATGEGLSEYRYLQTYDADTGLGGDSEAVILDAQYGPVPEEIDPSGDMAFIAETGVIRVGDRIAVLGSQIAGQDYNFLPEDGGTPVNQMVPRAAALLQPGVEDPAEPEATETETSGATGSPAADDVPPAPLLADFDLVAGMYTADDGSEAVASASGDGIDALSFCGVDATPGAAATGRFAARISGPEYAEAREVLVFASEDEAEAAAQQVLEPAQACPRDEGDGSASLNTVTPQPGEPLTTDVVVTSYEEGGSPSLGLQVLVVARSGPVLLLASRSSEGSVEGAADSTRAFLDDLATTFGWVTDSVGS